MPGLPRPRNCTRPGPFEVSLLTVSSSLPLGSLRPSRASCLFVRLLVSLVHLVHSFVLVTSVCRPLSQNPIVPNSLVCFVLPCYYAAWARVVVVGQRRVSAMHDGTLLLTSNTHSQLMFSKKCVIVHTLYARRYTLFQRRDRLFRRLTTK